MNMNDNALFIFGLQNDFLPVGNAEILGMEEISGSIKKMSGYWKHIIVINQNHPADHISFAACHPWRKPHQVIEIGNIQQYLWPIHCVSGTIGTLNPAWLTDLNPVIINHDSQREKENFSIFENESLLSYLTNNKIMHLFYCGFPLEFEIRENTFMAINHGLKVSLIKDGILSLASNKADLIYEQLGASDAKIINFSESLNN